MAAMNAASGLSNTTSCTPRYYTVEAPIGAAGDWWCCRGGSFVVVLELDVVDYYKIEGALGSYQDGDVARSVGGF